MMPAVDGCRADSVDSAGQPVGQHRLRYYRFASKSAGQRGSGGTTIAGRAFISSLVGLAYFASSPSYRLLDWIAAGSGARRRLR